jgi:hypothetical protein
VCARGSYEREREAIVDDDDTSKCRQAQDALLDEIIKNATSSSTRILALAEAWAWLMYPNQSHGGGSAALNK